MSRPTPSFSFIVPALNEEKNLPAVMEEIASIARKSGVQDYEVIVVDDGSTDGTASAVAKLSSRYGNIKYVRNETRQGVGKSFLAGAAIAQKKYCLIVPGDNEFDLDFLPGAVSMLSAGGSNFVVTHVLNPWLRPFHRRAISYFYINIFNLLFQTDFRYTNGIVIYPTDWIRSVRLVSSGYTFQSEVLLIAWHEGKRFACAGMNIRPRAHGKSKMFSFGVIAEILASLVRMKLAHRRLSLTETDNTDSK